MENQRFEALSRICLNNWHYIKHRTLSFDDGINFFTGHSGSGKSTVIDAMQLVLYANTDGRGFFNKAAADDSDRSLIEYLRGMINIGEDNSFSYLRNQNFSSTIVLELRQTDTGACQCVGVVFDVETATNEIGRMFFWHKGPIPDHEYRKADRTMSIDEVKNWLLANYSKEECYFALRYLSGRSGRGEVPAAVQARDPVPHEYQAGGLCQRVHLHGAGYSHRGHAAERDGIRTPAPPD